MTQRDLNRAVARATGETVDCIQRLGFNHVIVPAYLPVSRRRSSHGRRPMQATGFQHKQLTKSQFAQA